MHSGNLRKFEAAILHLRPGLSHDLIVSEDGTIHTLTERRQEGREQLFDRAVCRSYSRPLFVDAGEPPQLHVIAGRHPILDALMDAPVVPNDTHLDAAGPTSQLITGTPPLNPSQAAPLRQGHTCKQASVARMRRRIALSRGSTRQPS